MQHDLTIQSGSDAPSAAVAKTVLFSAMKNEAPFVLEWIAYHKVIGFDEIVICSNPSNDGMEELLAALAEAGEIRHLSVTVRPGSRPQGEAAWAFRKQVGHREGDWYLWLDADEFLNVHVGDHTVDALIAALGHRQCALINWRVFGSGGNARFPGRFIDPAFTGAAAASFVANLEQKALFRHSRAVNGFAHKGINRPHFRQPQMLTHDDVVTGSGGPLSEAKVINRRWLEGSNNARTARVHPDEFGWSLAQINHYMVRTPEFFELKRLRGRGAAPAASAASHKRHMPAFFSAHDRNEETDTTILRWQDAVTAEMVRLGAIPAVAAAKAASDRLVEALLADPGGAAFAPEAAATPAPPSASDSATSPALVPIPTQVPAARPRRVLFSAMKNEAPFLLEWIAYHKVIGFDEIVICSNPSNDGTEELLAALAATGEIVHFRAEPKPGASAQGIAARRFGAEVGYRAGDWYLWLDADEFLNVRVGAQTVEDLIGLLGNHECMLINWRIFGSGGNASFPGRFVSSAFTRASSQDFEPNAGVKSIFRMSQKFQGFATVGIHRPVVRKGAGLTADHVLTGSGGGVSVDFRRHKVWLEGASTSANSTVDLPEIGWSLAQINHYIVRTPEFFALKKVRGRGWKADSEGEANLRHTAEFFLKHDRNEEEDRSILVWEDRVTAEIARLTADRGVAAAAAQSAALVAGLLAGTALIPAPAPSGTAAMPAATTAAPAPAVAPADPAPGSEAAEPEASMQTFKLTFPTAESAHVTEAYARASVILEYGSGGSTMLAAELGKTVISVESDRGWAARMREALAAKSLSAEVCHVDIGPTRSWGRPVDRKASANFHLYALSVWDRLGPLQPDLVLIDGRFRAACLAAVRLRAQAPVRVLFDDYADRPYYHRVEALAHKDGMVGRMALFTVTPGPIPPGMLTEVTGWFSDPR